MDGWNMVVVCAWESERKIERDREKGRKVVYEPFRWVTYLYVYVYVSVVLWVFSFVLVHCLKGFPGRRSGGLRTVRAARVPFPSVFRPAAGGFRPTERENDTRVGRV